MSDEHKAALAKGRTESKAIRQYLEALRAHRPKRGRKRTVESVQARLDAVEAEMGDVNPMRELQLIQERRDLQAELEAMSETTDMTALEAGFVDVAESYSRRNSIAYASWREIGVAASVLDRAGIRRS